MGLAWNCRGLSNALSPTIPKIRALLSRTYYDFLFLMETKCNASSISPLFRSFGFDMSVGMDALGASGGLWVGWRKGEKISHVYSCMNFVILRIAKYNGLLWYLVLFYGAPKTAMRASVLHELEGCIASFEYPFLIIGDFNQVEYPCDKWGANSSSLNGAAYLTNEGKGLNRVYERLDKALASKDWFAVFPNTGLKHFPIQISDHAPIELDLNLVHNVNRKPYKLDSWALENEDCLMEIRKAWAVNVVGSPAFRTVRKLALVRQRVKSWALDKRSMDLEIREGKDEEYTKVDEEVRAFASAAASFWKQRAKLRWAVDGDACTKYFFNWVKGRAGRNFIYGIRNAEGDWVYDPGEVGQAFLGYFKDLYKAHSQHSANDSLNFLDAEDEIFTGITKQF
ncbi:uncharacterized protein LOC141627536 [Silene latifolia]|uniref:uncharacterized protein LOC141627536 n=1 Tax=Silene latifolia TaxID=37657 RepID=UPI003D76F176